MNKERLEILELEEERHGLELQYTILLNNLEKYPDDRYLMEERDSVREKLQEVNFQIESRRKLFDQTLQRWNQIIVEQRIEQQMIEKEVRENADKEEY